MNVRLRVFGLIVAVGVFLTFVLQNTDAVDMRFLRWKFQSPLWLLCLGIYVLGMLSGWAVFSFLGRWIKQATVRPKA